MSILPAISASTMGGPPLSAVTLMFRPCFVKKPSYSAISNGPPVAVAGPDRASCTEAVADVSDPPPPEAAAPELQAATTPVSRARPVAPTVSFQVRRGVRGRQLRCRGRAGVVFGCMRGRSPGSSIRRDARWHGAGTAGHRRCVYTVDFNVSMRMHVILTNPIELVKNGSGRVPEAQVERGPGGAPGLLGSGTRAGLGCGPLGEWGSGCVRGAGCRTRTGVGRDSGVGSRSGVGARSAVWESG